VSDQARLTEDEQTIIDVKQKWDALLGTSDWTDEEKEQLNALILEEINYAFAHDEAMRTVLIQIMKLQ